MAGEAQSALYQALKAHTSELEITRGAVSGLDVEVLDRRVEAAQRLLEWLSQALEPQPPAFPTAQTPPPSSSPADRDQIPPSAPDPPVPSRQQ
jgi:hypothetical protein